MIYKQLRSYYNLPIRLADFPVGPRSKTFGWVGSSPAFRKIFSAHLEMVLIRNVLPTPPPPRKQKLYE